MNLREDAALLGGAAAAAALAAIVGRQYWRGTLTLRRSVGFTGLALAMTFTASAGWTVFAEVEPLMRAAITAMCAMAPLAAITVLGEARTLGERAFGAALFLIALALGAGSMGSLIRATVLRPDAVVTATDVTRDAAVLDLDQTRIEREQAQRLVGIEQSRLDAAAASLAAADAKAAAGPSPERERRLAELDGEIATIESALACELRGSSAIPGCLGWWRNGQREAVLRPGRGAGSRAAEGQLSIATAERDRITGELEQERADLLGAQERAAAAVADARAGVAAAQSEVRRLAEQQGASASTVVGATERPYEGAVREMLISAAARLGLDHVSMSLLVGGLLTLFAEGLATQVMARATPAALRDREIALDVERRSRAIESRARRRGVIGSARHAVHALLWGDGHSETPRDRLVEQAASMERAALAPPLRLPSPTPPARVVASTATRADPALGYLGRHRARDRPGGAHGHRPGGRGKN